MEIIIYQTAIVFLICISAIFGRKTRNYTVLVVSIFTVIQVFMLWLGILQFFTILIAYYLSESFFSRKPFTQRPIKNKMQELWENQDNNISSRNSNSSIWENRNINMKNYPTNQDYIPSSILKEEEEYKL